MEGDEDAEKRENNPRTTKVAVGTSNGMSRRMMNKDDHDVFFCRRIGPVVVSSMEETSAFATIVNEEVNENEPILKIGLGTKEEITEAIEVND